MRIVCVFLLSVGIAASVGCNLCQDPVESVPVHSATDLESSSEDYRYLLIDAKDGTGLTWPEARRIAVDVYKGDLWVPIHKEEYVRVTRQLSEQRLFWIGYSVPPHKSWTANYYPSSSNAPTFRWFAESETPSNATVGVAAAIDLEATAPVFNTTTGHMDRNGPIFRDGIAQKDKESFRWNKGAYYAKAWVSRDMQEKHLAVVAVPISQD